MKKTLKYLLLGVGLNASVVATVWADTFYEITITNLTRGQIMSPFVAATHKRGFKLFEAGQPASPGLAALAQDAVTDDLVDELEDSDRVRDIVVGTGPTLPGATTVLKIRTRSSNRFISLASMMVTTNDAFVALNGVRGRRSGRTLNRRMPAYDAGAEDNDESCAYIPGPPCGNMLLDSGIPGEGYVHIHSGVHDVGDLDSILHDWRNPVVAISIRRVRD